MKQDENRQINNGEFTLQQERVHTLIHAIGIVLGLIGVPVLIILALKNDNANSIISTCIYGFCFLLMFISSTLFHSCRHERRKCKFELMDYISIYFLISGTYTPFVLSYMPNSSGIFLLSLVWLCAIGGTLFKLLFKHRSVVASVGFYLGMGLLFLIRCQEFFSSMPAVVAWLVIGGVLLYIIGVIFFLWQKWYYHHAIWHSFVLIASLCHFIAVTMTVV